MARSKDAKLGVAFRDSYFFERKSEKILVRDLERVQQPQSLPAAHKGSTGLCQLGWQAIAPGASSACRGRDHLWGPQEQQCHGRKSSYAVCGCLWVGCGTSDVSCELLRACFAEEAITGQPPYCLEHKGTLRAHSGTEPQVLWEGLVENQAPMCGAAFVSVSCLGHKA